MIKTVKIAVMILALLMIACAKIPDKIQSPSFKIDIGYENGSETYSVKFSGGIANENSATALADVKGEIGIVDSGRKGVTLVTFPFFLDVVLPFSMGVIDVDKKCSRAEIDALAAFFEIDVEGMLKNKGSEGMYIDDNRVSLQIVSYEKRDIMSLLDGKINEKNK